MTPDRTAAAPTLTADSTASTPPALCFDGVTVRGTDERAGVDVTLIRGIDWQVQAGEHWAVVGPNGAGKTTLLNVITGAMEPASGTVRVLGEQVGAAGMRDPRLRVGVMGAGSQRFAMRMSALDVVVLRSSGPIALLGNAVPARDHERAAELLDLFGCGAIRDRRFGDCSQGERQRILLARSLMRDPALLLLDEPTTGLDLPGREGLLQAVARLAADRPELATVTVTHHVEELASSTTHALLVRDGDVVAAGPVEATLTEEALSTCFGVPVSLLRLEGRWVARARVPGF